MTAGRRAEAYGRIEDEIRREKAASLGRAGERLGEALRETERIARELDAARQPADRARLHAAYEDARARAKATRYALLIQREAIGLRTHRLVDQLFPEPPRRPRDA